MVQVRVKLHDGTFFSTLHPSWSSACIWASKFHHHIHCVPHLCVHGFHNGMQPPKGFEITVTVVGEAGDALTHGTTWE